MKASQNDAVLNPAGTKEIILFFDYNCIHCKREYEVFEKLLAERKDIKVILKPIVILSETSLYATQIGQAIFMMDPKKYDKFFKAMMDRFSGAEDPIMYAIQTAEVGINDLKDTLEKNGDQIGKIIDENSDLADKIGVQGTPAIYIEGKLYGGEQDLETLKKLVK